MENQPANEKTKRGFAIMNSERQRKIASQGGKAAHRKGVAHEWDKEEAKQAGKRGASAAGYKRLNRTENDGRDDILWRVLKIAKPKATYTGAFSFRSPYKILFCYFAATSFSDAVWTGIDRFHYNCPQPSGYLW